MAIILLFQRRLADENHHEMGELSKGINVKLQGIGIMAQLIVFGSVLIVKTIVGFCHKPMMYFCQIFLDLKVLSHEGAIRLMRLTEQCLNRAHDILKNNYVQGICI